MSNIGYPPQIREKRTLNSGHIQLILGPMFSGKTTELIRRLKRYQIARYECLIVKYARDVRYDKDDIATHDKQTLPAVNATKLEDLRLKAENYDIIGIDEGQFFPDVVKFSEDMANKGKTVIVAALDGTFQRKGFQNILDIIPLAENVIKINAVCMNCFEEGSYTKRISQDTELEVIGGAEKYMAVCRKCYFTPNVIPVSPREPLKTLADNETALCIENGVSPAKKALFNNEITQSKENLKQTN